MRGHHDVRLQATRVSRRLKLKAETQGGRKTWHEEDEPDVEEMEDVGVAPRKRSRAQVKQEVRFIKHQLNGHCHPLVIAGGDLREWYWE